MTQEKPSSITKPKSAITKSKSAASTLDQISVAKLKGVGPAMVEKLARFDIHSIQDLLFHLPHRYQDRTRITPIGSLRPGIDVVLEGEVKNTNIVFGKRRSLACKIQDGSGSITLRFFHFNASQKQQLSSGSRIRCYGEVRRGSSGLELYHPEYKAIHTDQPVAVEEHLTPVYPTTEGFTQQGWRKLITQALTLLQPNTLSELLPDNIDHEITQNTLFGSHSITTRPTLEQAIRFLHQPPPDVDTEQLLQGKHPVQQRLAFEELIAHHLSLLQLRHIAQQHTSPALPLIAEAKSALLSQLRFDLTRAQNKVVDEISHDLNQQIPMLRLLQGDVGSGKTVVAAMATLHGLNNGYQVAIMAPTEILSEQHHQAFNEWFEPLGYKVDWLAGKLKGKARERTLLALKSGETQLIVGTHALFQDGVDFHKLGLIIIDEQHRFGVHQRLALREKAIALGVVPHQLIMTATPIPRTLAMTAYADLDVSIIDELPPGRTPVETVAIDNNRRQQVLDRVRNACQEGRQVYWVCTLIEESESLQCQAAEVLAEELSIALEGIKVGLIHGRMKPSEKADVMAPFYTGQTQLLVATTVIEVGVNVPNASLMIIENPERLGLAQLHQLRGRVGRGSTASYCVLLYATPLSEQSKTRLSVMRETNDGFVIAEKDLELRGPGEVLGTRQTGLMLFKVAELQRDGHLLPDVKHTAHQLLNHHPEVVEPLIQRWLGDNPQFAQA